MDAVGWSVLVILFKLEGVSREDDGKEILIRQNIEIV